MGDDCVWRCENMLLLSSLFESGDEARRGDDDRGDETEGRLSQVPVKMGGGANDNMVSAGGDLSARELLFFGINCNSESGSKKQSVKDRLVGIEKVMTFSKDKRLGGLDVWPCQLSHVLDLDWIAGGLRERRG